MLSVTKDGARHRDCGFSPGGINCGAACSASFTSGAVVTPTAMPGCRVQFSQLERACNGAESCIVNMSQAKET